jgi:DNA modification methylase
LKINGNAKSVLDCFGGTGTTLMACEELNRKCYMCELDPHYCDVIIARWEKYTGKTAIKVEEHNE